MGDIFGRPEKITYAKSLFQIGLKYLEGLGYEIRKVPKAGKKSLREILKDGNTSRVVIRTSQDQWFAFPRDADGQWLGLDDVGAERVIVVVLNTRDEDADKVAFVHDFTADAVRKRLNLNYKARIKAGYSVRDHIGNWISLYGEYDKSTASLAGAGIGNEYKPVDRIPLNFEGIEAVETEEVETEDAPITETQKLAVAPSSEGLTIPEAKRRLAITFGVDPSNIKITVEG